MVSPDQAEQAADSLLEPAKQELAAKQDKLARRKAIRTSLLDALVPAALGAGAALVAIEYLDSTFIGSLIFGSMIGATVGSGLRKSK
jgi:hypothetical protein